MSINEELAKSHEFDEWRDSESLPFNGDLSHDIRVVGFFLIAIAMRQLDGVPPDEGNRLELLGREIVELGENLHVWRVR